MTEAIRVPEIGENVESGVVVAVHINVGDTVAVDDTVIELETDKALVEIPSPFAGRITEVLARAGSQMRVGDVIARVAVDGDADDMPADPSMALDTAPSVDSADAKTAASVPPAVDEPVKAAWLPAGKQDVKDVVPPLRPPAPAAPSTRRLARELGIDIHDISGSGPGGRISEADVKAHVRRLSEKTTPSAVMPADAARLLPDFSRWGAVAIESVDTVRRLTSESTTHSWTTIPHVTQYDEADITDVQAFMTTYSARAGKAGMRLTLTAILARVCAEALKRFPRFNASIDVVGQRIIYKHYVHIGIAVDTPRGLLVPVIRDADRRSILDLAKAVDDLAARARSKRIRSDEMEGGTFTISNQGGIGGIGFTPIVLWPQVAILGVSRAAVKPVYRNDRFAPRTMLPLALSYDHRMIDGADAARFLRWICDGLAQPLTLIFD